MKKPKIELYWTKTVTINEFPYPTEHFVNWRLVGANGEIMCQSTQGFRDKTDAMRSVDACAAVLFNYPMGLKTSARIVGPGGKPK